MRADAIASVSVLLLTPKLSQLFHPRGGMWGRAMRPAAPPMHHATRSSVHTPNSFTPSFILQTKTQHNAAVKGLLIFAVAFNVCVCVCPLSVSLSHTHTHTLSLSLSHAVALGKQSLLIGGTLQRTLTLRKYKSKGKKCCSTITCTISARGVCVCACIQGCMNTRSGMEEGGGEDDGSARHLSCWKSVCPCGDGAPRVSMAYFGRIGVRGGPFPFTAVPCCCCCCC